jgi:hypothetical protein
VIGSVMGSQAPITAAAVKVRIACFKGLDSLSLDVGGWRVTGQKCVN